MDTNNEQRIGTCINCGTVFGGLGYECSTCRRNRLLDAELMAAHREGFYMAGSLALEGATLDAIHGTHRTRTATAWPVILSPLTGCWYTSPLHGAAPRVDAAKYCDAHTRVASTNINRATLAALRG